MKKLGKKVVFTFMCGVISCTSATSAWAANVVTVSSVPGETSSVAANKSASSNYVSSTSTASVQKRNASNVVTAVGTPDAAAESVSSVTSSAAVKSSNAYTTSTVPVITATNAIDDNNGSASNDVNVSTYAGNTQKRKEVSIIEASGSYDDSAAQAYSESSAMGFCVILSSSPTGTMKDITG